MGYAQNNIGCGIYRIVNTRNGKFYIGSTYCFARRKRDHFKQLMDGSHESPKLLNAYNAEKDKTVFVFEQLLVCEKKNALLYEQQFINFLNPAYNTSKTAGNVEMTEEVREKIRIKAIGRKMSKESIAKMVLTKVGRKLSDETKAKMSIAKSGKKPNNYGKPSSKKGTKMSDEQKAKLSLIKKGKPLSELHRLAAAAGVKKWWDARKAAGVQS